MAYEPGPVAKAFLDSLPSVDFNKQVSEARKQLSIALLGDDALADALLGVLRQGPSVPRDTRVFLWKHAAGVPAPTEAGKPELVIVFPATEDNVAAAKSAFPGVQALLVNTQGPANGTGPDDPVVLPSMDPADVKRLLVPRLVDRLWERRLALGRGVPITRDYISKRLTRLAARDVKVLLGSVAGASGGRSGAPTPATAQVLMHQAGLIVSIAAVAGEQLDDRSQIFRRVAPNLLPTLLLDGAEAGVSKLAAMRGGDKYAGLLGHVAAYLTRPPLTASSTFLAGTVARRVFRIEASSPSVLARTRDLSKKALGGAGQTVFVAAGAVAARLKLPGPGKKPPSDGSDPFTAGDPPRADA